TTTGGPADALAGLPEPRSATVAESRHGPRSRLLEPADAGRALVRRPGTGSRRDLVPGRQLERGVLLERLLQAPPERVAASAGAPGAQPSDRPGEDPRPGLPAADDRCEADRLPRRRRHRGREGERAADGARRDRARGVGGGCNGPRRRDRWA